LKDSLDTITNHTHRLQESLANGLQLLMKWSSVTIIAVWNELLWNYAIVRTTSIVIITSVLLAIMMVVIAASDKLIEI
jgi:hypothetical protein